MANYLKVNVKMHIIWKGLYSSFQTRPKVWKSNERLERYSAFYTCEARPWPWTRGGNRPPRPIARYL